MCYNNNITAKINNKFWIAPRQFFSSKFPWTRGRNNSKFTDNLCTRPKTFCRVSYFKQRLHTLY